MVVRCSFVFSSVAGCFSHIFFVAVELPAWPARLPLGLGRSSFFLLLDLTESVFFLLLGRRFCGRQPRSTFPGRFDGRSVCLLILSFAVKKVPFFSMATCFGRRTTRSWWLSLNFTFIYRVLPVLAVFKANSSFHQSFCVSFTVFYRAVTEFYRVLFFSSTTDLLGPYFFLFFLLLTSGLSFSPFCAYPFLITVR